LLLIEQETKIVQSFNGYFGMDYVLFFKVFSLGLFGYLFRSLNSGYCLNKSSDVNTATTVKTKANWLVYTLLWH